jgi:hypothetical protein
MYRSVNSRGEVLVTSDRHAADRHGKIERIYRSKRDAVPTLTVCKVPKETAPWEIASELEPIDVVLVSGKDLRLTYQLTDMGKLGERLLELFSIGALWDSQIVIVPTALVPKQEKATTDEADASAD